MNKPLMSDSMYSKLKFFALILLPALGALYFGLAQIWHLPKAEEVVGSVAVLDTFLGVLVRYAAESFNKSDEKYIGEITPEVTQDGRKVFSLDLNTHPEAIYDKSEVVFKVNNQ
jgi:hypothetical protein